MTTIADPTDVLTQTTTLVETHYVFPDVAKTLAARLRERLAAGAYDEQPDPAELARLVTTDLQSVNGDKHLRLVFHADEIPDRDEDADLEAIARLAAENANGVRRTECLDGNVGLLELRPILFSPQHAADAVAGALTVLSTTKALIIDLRDCDGGHPAMVGFLLTYLFDDEPVLYGTLHDREPANVKQSWTLPYVPGSRFGGSKPVYVLTSSRTFSGGEDLAYSLQQLGRGTIIGERTGGGAHPRRGFRVHPHLLATVPVARSVNPISGTNWEGVGVRPDVEMMADSAFDVAYQRALAEMAES